MRSHPIGTQFAAAFAFFVLAVSGCGPTDPTDPTGPFFCNYENPFSAELECNTYSGVDWDYTSAKAQCDTVFSITVGTLTEEPCADDPYAGICTYDFEGPLERSTKHYGTPPVETLQFFCEDAGGIFTTDGIIVPPDDNLMPEAYAAMTSTATVTVSPECIDDTCLDPIIAARGALTFTPVSGATTGIILFPGAAVDPRAYAVAAQALAEHGYLVAIVPVPGKFALNQQSRADDVKTANPTIAHWYVGGHSVGGVAATAYVFDGGVVDGLIMWASYPADTNSISTSSVPVVSLFGDRDGVSTPSEILGNAYLLPPATMFIPLPGGNHGQFGYYGDQENDLVPWISRDNQHDMLVDATVYFINSVVAGGVPPVHAGFAAAIAEEDDWCRQAQLSIANTTVAELPFANMDNPRFDDPDLFALSKAAADALATPPVKLSTHVLLEGNHNLLSAPPIVQSQILCKLKSREALEAENLIVAGPAAQTCEVANQSAFNWALGQLSGPELTAHQASGRDVVYVADTNEATGVEWLRTDFVSTLNGLNLEVGSVALPVPLTGNFPPEVLGVHYCKLWSPAAALVFLLGGNL